MDLCFSVLQPTRQVENSLQLTNNQNTFPPKSKTFTTSAVKTNIKFLINIMINKRDNFVIYANPDIVVFLITSFVETKWYPLHFIFLFFDSKTELFNV